MPTPQQNEGHTVRMIGARRIVLAFNPGSDDPDLLRTVVLVVRTMAMAAAIRHGVQEIDNAQEKITSALNELGRIDSVRKAANGIQKSAATVDSQCSTLSARIRRLLEEAAAALTAAEQQRTPETGDAQGAS